MTILSISISFYCSLCVCFAFHKSQSPLRLYTWYYNESFKPSFQMVWATSGLTCIRFSKVSTDLIPGFDNTKRCPKGSLVFQICNSLPSLWRSSPISPWQGTSSTYHSNYLSWFGCISNPKFVRVTILISRPTESLLYLLMEMVLSLLVRCVSQQSKKLWRQEENNVIKHPQG